MMCLHMLSSLCRLISFCVLLVVAAAQADAGKEKKGFFSSLSKKFDKKPEQAIKDAAKAAQNVSSIS